MIYEQFKTEICQRLQEEAGDARQIVVRSIPKNNGVTKDAFVIMEDGFNIAPTLYLDPYYEMAKTGVSLNAICHQIWDAYFENRADHSIDIRFFTNYSSVRERLVCKLINYEKNRALLEDIPCQRFLDLAIVCYCLIRMDDFHGSATILVHYSHLELWNITEDELFFAAMENTPKLLESQLKNLNEMLGGTIPDDLLPDADFELDAEAESDTKFELDAESAWDVESRLHEGFGLDDEGSVCSAPPMYVLSNDRNYFGAVCLLYHGLLKKYSDQFQSDFFILPSSIHEVILVPTLDSEGSEEFSRMVREVNRSSLLPEEILSDHAYYYSRADDRIVACL